MLIAACERVISAKDLTCDCDALKADAGMTDDEFNDILDAACNALANITRLPIGRCVTVYRPCLDRCHYFSCPCGCAPAGIPLPGLMPEVTEVRIDGQVLPTTEYVTLWTNSGPSLERINPDGTRGRWPNTQNIVAPATAPDTFAVSIRSGLPADAIMKAAAAEIACDIFARLSGSRETDEGVVSASGYGMSLSYLRFGDPTDQETLNLVGLSWVRRFVASAGGLNNAAMISNDMLRGWSLATVS